MRIASTLVVLLAALLGGATAAGADTLTFDETPALPAWGGGTLADGFYIPSLTPTYGAATLMSGITPNTAFSGQNAMFNYDVREGRLFRSTAFDMTGAWFKDDARYNHQTSTFAARGYDAAGNLLYSSVHTLTDNWEFISINMAGIHQFGFDPLVPGQQNMQMDNLIYTDAAAVPEPGSIALLGLGLVGVGLASRRRKTRAS